MTEFLRARYRLFPVPGEAGGERAQHLAREQTVECPPGIAPEAEERALGRVDRVDRLPDGGSQVTISYPVAASGGELLQLLNVLWGNVSLWSGVRLEAVDWPSGLLARFRGPALGVDGLRRLCAADPGRPLLATALKPMGSTVRELARRAGEVALGGVDLVKDDHGLTDQEWAPFRERVLACAEMVHRANRATGGSTLYAPNLTGPVDRMAQRLEVLADAGCRAALIAPLLVGLDTLRALAETSGVALIAHPAFAGSFASSTASSERGIAPGVLFGDIFRLAGADVVVFPNAEGRFPYTVEDCRAIEARLSAPLATIQPSLLMLGGGIDAARLERWIPVYGPNTIYLLGGSLFARASPRDGAAELANLVRRLAPRTPREAS
jgi:ribulose-bisphosphate carboxylase large chain